MEVRIVDEDKMRVILDFAEVLEIDWFGTPTGVKVTWKDGMKYVVLRPGWSVATRMPEVEG